MDEVGLEIEKFIYSIILVLFMLGGMCFKIVRLYNVLKCFDDGVVNLSKCKSKSLLLVDILLIYLDDFLLKVFFSFREVILW